MSHRRGGPASGEQSQRAHSSPTAKSSGSTCHPYSGTCSPANTAAPRMTAALSPCSRRIRSNDAPRRNASSLTATVAATGSKAGIDQARRPERLAVPRVAGRTRQHQPGQGAAENARRQAPRRGQPGGAREGGKAPGEHQSAGRRLHTWAPEVSHRPAQPPQQGRRMQCRHGGVPCPGGLAAPATPPRTGLARRCVGRCPSCRGRRFREGGCAQVWIAAT